MPPPGRSDDPSRFYESRVDPYGGRLLPICCRTEADLRDHSLLRSPWCPGGPSGPSRLTRRGAPVYTELDVRGLLTRLQQAGYGWVRPDGVRKLADLAAGGVMTGTTGQ